ncbi:aldo/keto reductase [Microbacterium rhizophilus]|uniref:aldo/keto reductase n=1 Tax=Microbacterium rhizophilus TaxID=3138934 RepID=UPI0031F02C87
MTSSALPLHPLGATGLQVTSLTLGGGPLGSMPRLFGNEVPEGDAIETVAAALDAGIRTIDTSNGYSEGESERRLAKALAAYGALPATTVIGMSSPARVAPNVAAAAAELPDELFAELEALVPPEEVWLDRR